jgi:hypothetical protein
MDWLQVFNPLVWLGLVVATFFCLVLVAFGLCIIAAFVLFCWKLWCTATATWREIREEYT